MGLQHCHWICSCMRVCDWHSIKIPVTHPKVGNPIGENLGEIFSPPLDNQPSNSPTLLST